jgi:DNA modification methylase
LYPVLIDEDSGEVLDGRTRLKADPNWKKVFVKTHSPEEKLKIKYHANWHRKIINRTDVLTEIAEETGWRGLEPFAKFLNVSEMTISRYLPQKYKDTVKSQNATANRLLATFEEFDYEFSVWDAEEERPEGYGSKDFHGNCSPTIIYGLLSRYATTDSVIFDPMAGSGTFLDVAKAMGYTNILARDIKCVRPDIEQGDAECTELKDESVDFIFVHFPYWNLVEYTEDDERDLSRLRFNDFVSKVERIFIEMHRILKKNGFLAIMIGDLRKGGLVDLESDFSVLGRKYFTLWDKIIKKVRTWAPETRGQRMGLAIISARARNSTVLNHDTILVFRRE